jgi:hypothetical protein
MDKSNANGTVKHMRGSVLIALSLLLLVVTGCVTYRVEAATNVATAIPPAGTSNKSSSMPIERVITIAIVSAAVR